MKIADLRVDGFGVWSGLELERLPAELVVFFGPNEAGKTTLREFLCAMLYGFTAERRRRYLPPVHGGRAGGSLRLAGPGGLLEVQRHVDPDDAYTGPDRLRLTAAHGETLDAGLLPSLLGGVDEPTFHNLFAVGLREMQYLGTLDDTAAAEYLYGFSAGFGGASLAEVLRELQAARGRLLDGPGRASRLRELAAREDGLRRQLAAQLPATGRWVQLLAQRDLALDESRSLEQRRGELERQLLLAETAAQLRGLWEEARRLDARHAALGPLAELPRDAVDQLRELQRQLDRCRSRWAEARQQQRQLRTETAELRPHAAFWRVAVQAEALRHQQGWLSAQQQQFQRDTRDEEELELQLQVELEQLGLPAESAGGGSPPIAARAGADWELPARRLKRATHQLEAARTAARAARQQAEGVAQQIDQAAGAQAQAGLAARLEHAGQEVTNLRRRLQLDDRLEQIQRQTADLQEQGRYWLQQQLLPLPLLAGLGALFALGAAMVLSGLCARTFGSTPATGWLITLLGIGLGGAALAVKNILQRSAARRLEACQRQLDMLRVQAGNTRDQCAQLDAQLPAGGGPLAARLPQAQQRLESLEQLLPLEGGRQAALEQARAAEQAEAEAHADWERARQRWQTTLRRLGGQADWTPGQVRTWMGRTDQLAGLRRRLQELRQQRAQRQRELAAASARIEPLIQQLGAAPESELVDAQLEQLLALVQQHQQRAERRRQLRARWRQIGGQQTRLLRSARRLRGRRRQVLAACGVTDEAELEQLQRRMAEAAQLKAQRDQGWHAVAEALAGRFTREMLEAELTSYPGSALEERIRQLRAEWEDARQTLARLYQRQGELSEKITALADDRQPGETRLALGQLAQQRADARRQWQVLAAASHLLHEVRESYETQRQPAALAEASAYLRAMTSDQYRRVWTPLGQRTLRVDDRQGRALPVELLSRGTREQVFLSLRLALVSVYAARGIKLPLVLDDVLVNFDAPRTQAAAQLLRDFAHAGHQLLLFTCHEHIRTMFQALDVDVRQLPRSRETADTQPSVDAETLPAALASQRRPRRGRPAVAGSASPSGVRRRRQSHDKPHARRHAAASAQPARDHDPLNEDAQLPASELGAEPELLRSYLDHDTNEALDSIDPEPVDDAGWEDNDAFEDDVTGTAAIVNDAREDEPAEAADDDDLADDDDADADDWDEPLDESEEEEEELDEDDVVDHGEDDLVDEDDDSNADDDDQDDMIDDAAGLWDEPEEDRLGFDAA